MILFPVHLLASVAFFAIHPNAGVHFSAFAEACQEQGIPYIAYGGDQAALKMQGLAHLVDISDETPVPKIPLAELKEKAVHLADRISKEADLVIIDVGSPLSLELIPPLKERGVKVYAYWDNFECDTEAPYSKLAKQIAALADQILYANANFSNSWGIGYYPLEDLDSIRSLRNDRSLKKIFLEKHSLDPTLPVLLFIGGANKNYENAFENFSSCVNCSISNWNFLLHRHPRAEEEGLSDKKIVQNTCWESKASISQGSLEEAIAFADSVLYYQTTTVLKPLLLGIPVAEWGGFKDIFVKEGLISILDSKPKVCNFLYEKVLSPPKSQEALYLVGFRSDWKNRLFSILKKTSTTSSISNK